MLLARSRCSRGRRKRRAYARAGDHDEALGKSGGKEQIVRAGIHEVLRRYAKRSGEAGPGKRAIMSANCAGDWRVSASSILAFS